MRPCHRAHPEQAYRRQRGLGLVEVLIAAALAAILLGSLFAVTFGGLRTQGISRNNNEMAYQARFALGLIVNTARSTPPKPLSKLPPAATTTSDWLSPVMYCLNAAGQLMLSTPADSGCSAGRVLAENVGMFSVERPGPPLASQPEGPVDRPAAKVTLVVKDASGRQSIELTATARLGGGTL